MSPRKVNPFLQRDINSKQDTNITSQCEKIDSPLITIVEPPSDTNSDIEVHPVIVDGLTLNKDIPSSVIPKLENTVITINEPSAETKQLENHISVPTLKIEPTSISLPLQTTVITTNSIQNNSGPVLPGVQTPKVTISEIENRTQYMPNSVKTTSDKSDHSGNKKSESENSLASISDKQSTMSDLDNNDNTASELSLPSVSKNSNVSLASSKCLNSELPDPMSTTSPWTRRGSRRSDSGVSKSMK